MTDFPYTSVQEVQSTHFPGGEGSDLGPTWSVLDREPGMDDLAEGATEILKKMGEDLKIFPFQDRDGKDRLFLARFEFPKYGESSQFPETIKGESVAFVQFLAGFPIDVVEMLLLIGESSTKADKVQVQAGTGVTAPVPKDPAHFFQWPDTDKILLNLTAIPTKDVAKILAPNLEGEPKPTTPKWWFQVQIAGGDKKWPVIGEFIGLGVRLMPGTYWGHQKSSPFIFSGCYFDSVHLTGGFIKTVNEPTDMITYPTYTVTWRGRDFENIRPSDWAEYKINDRVSILKDCSTTKTEQTWKDDDTKVDCDKSAWMLVPLSYYGGL